MPLEPIGGSFLTLGRPRKTGLTFLPRSGPALVPAALVANLPTPFYIAHRGGPMLAADESMTAYALAYATGAHALEVDVRLLSDGTPVIMHDSTVDRTTDGTGNVADKTLAQWRALTMDHAGLVQGSGWPTEAPPTLAEFLAVYGNQVCIVAQPYITGGTGLAAIDAAVTAAGINKGTVWIQSGDLTDLATARAAGYPIMVIDGNATPDWAAHAAANRYAVAMANASVTQQKVTDCHAAGLKLVPYAPTGHFARDKHLAWGTDGMFTDVPGYMRESITFQTTDLFSTQKPAPGSWLQTGTGSRAWVAPNIFQLNGGTTHSLGYMRPANLTNYTVTFEAQFLAGASTSAAGLYLFAGKSDFFANDGRTTQDGMLLDAADGYRFSAVGDGTLRIILLTDDANTANILTNGPGTFALNTWATYRLTVTPTSLKWEQVGVGSPTTITTSNATMHRNLKYLGIGSLGTTTQVQFRNIAIT